MLIISVDFFNNIYRILNPFELSRLFIDFRFLPIASGGVALWQRKKKKQSVSFGVNNAQGEREPLHVSVIRLNLMT